ncbi:alpha/beta hydrolase [Longispora fulva]|uniref:Pimeloyl-ACP methyl ester carboxylesterase n=1 Tax=Longispora fulva TaxID=619741 RepID=A0A8J7KL33_9ACTN|nr:alpha/beta hydrolase [Longispora fulva]MBG6138844.1 pimeloyl-ACP methyl ester carboxylesterase [Longispora fulva]GIG58338.1 alpha/beta hydrolase [Longispora fulva]
MTVRYTTNDDVRIAYEVLGDPNTGVPLLLIMGLDFQMIWWPDAFCQQLVDAGFAVVRFDNRDAGLSTHLAKGDSYRGNDMVADTVAVLDAVGWKSANVFGASLGASIAQGLALLHPERVRSLVSCMGGPATAGVLKTLTQIRIGTVVKLARLPKPTTREEEIDNVVTVYRAMSSPGYPFPEAWAREAAGESYDRAPRDLGATQRQTVAGRRFKVPPLRTISQPTLVIHGADDPLVRPAAGRDTARQIPGATFVAYPGMGHSLPEALWPDIVERTRALAAQA